MSPTRLKLIWLMSLALIALASYLWPGFGTVFVCSSVILLGVINNLLSIESSELGMFTGSSAAVLACATCAGAGLGIMLVALFTAAAGIAGYGFAATRVGTIDSDESESNDKAAPSKIKSGRGGDFGGGGADGRY